MVVTEHFNHLFSFKPEYTNGKKLSFLVSGSPVRFTYPVSDCNRELTDRRYKATARTHARLLTTASYDAMPGCDCSDAEGEQRDTPRCPASCVHPASQLFITGLLERPSLGLAMTSIHITSTYIIYIL